MLPCSFPTIASKEKAELLKRWIAAGENLKACEHSITASRKNSLQGRRVMELVAVKDMSKPPWNFSELLI